MEDSSGLRLSSQQRDPAVKGLGVFWGSTSQGSLCFWPLLRHFSEHLMFVRRACQGALSYFQLHNARFMRCQQATVR